MVRLLMATMALLLMAGCGGGGSTGGGGGSLPPAPAPKTAGDYLKDKKFTTDQPKVLEQVGVHHAYAKGLTGKGIRIGVEDSIVDYTQSGEFGDRVKTTEAEGAKLYYDRYGLYEHNTCPGSVCVNMDSDQGNDKEAWNRKVKEVVQGGRGWPTRDDSTFLRDTSYPRDGLGALLTWKEIPSPYVETHGTFVASVAAGKTLGVAPGATVIPIAKNLTDDQSVDIVGEYVSRALVELLPTADRQVLDRETARLRAEDLAKSDIINRSYGFDFSLAAANYVTEEIEWMRSYLPNFLAAEFQTGVAPANKTLVVYASGNAGLKGTTGRVPGFGAILPYGYSELRDHMVAVTATDPDTGAVAYFASKCGPLPSNWNSALHGRHYCMAAPGITNGLVPVRPGVNEVARLGGTSFAAPMVSGGLALMMEQFRGTMGNTAILKRLKDTANNRGVYADSTVYGAGLMDLEAALRPVGSAMVAGYRLSKTTLALPSAVSPMVAGLEVTAFDAMGFPFWLPLGDRIAKVGGVSPIPSFDEEATEIGAEVLGQRFVDLGGNPFVERDHGFRVGMASRSMSLNYRRNGWDYGLNLDDAGYLGGKPSGAFGSMRSGFSWVSHTIEKPMGVLSMRLTGTVALGSPWYKSGSMFRASPHVLSGLRVRIGTAATGLTVEQPLRAESGSGVFRLENGRVEDGRRVVEEHKVSLRPRSREIRMTLRHNLPVGLGVLAMEVGGSANAGHESGETVGRAGMAFKAAW